MTGERGLSISCSEVVELITDYLENRLEPERRLTVEAHLDLCEPCVIYLDQMRETIRTLGHVPLETLSPEAQSTLLEAFRHR